MKQRAEELFSGIPGEIGVDRARATPNEHKGTTAFSSAILEEARGKEMIASGRKGARQRARFG